MPRDSLDTDNSDKPNSKASDSYATTQEDLLNAAYTQGPDLGNLLLAFLRVRLHPIASAFLAEGLFTPKFQLG